MNLDSPLTESHGRSLNDIVSVTPDNMRQVITMLQKKYMVEIRLDGNVAPSPWLAGRMKILSCPIVFATLLSRLIGFDFR